MDTLNLLQRATKENLIMEPFPHIVLHNALSEEVADTLRAEFPENSTIIGTKEMGDNKRFSYGASQAFQEKRISRQWEDFLQQHTRQDFFTLLYQLFSDVIKETYPQLTIPSTPMVGVRKKDIEADVLLDTQICINTPVLGKQTSVRGPHIDREYKLFAGLYYLREEYDDTDGGDLLLYRWKDGAKPQYYKKQFVSGDLVEEEKKVPYTHNTFVVFLNSPKAIHGVSPRGVGMVRRQFVNIVAEMREPLFSTDKQTESFIRRMKKVFS